MRKLILFLSLWVAQAEVKDPIFASSEWFQENVNTTTALSATPYTSVLFQKPDCGEQCEKIALVFEYIAERFSANSTTTDKMMFARIDSEQNPEIAENLFVREDSEIVIFQSIDPDNEEVKWLEWEKYDWEKYGELDFNVTVEASPDDPVVLQLSEWIETVIKDGVNCQCTVDPPSGDVKTNKSSSERPVANVALLYGNITDKFEYMSNSPREWNNDWTPPHREVGLLEVELVQDKSDIDEQWVPVEVNGYKGDENDPDDNSSFPKIVAKMKKDRVKELLEILGFRNQVHRMRLSNGEECNVVCDRLTFDTVSDEITSVAFERFTGKRRVKIPVPAVYINDRTAIGVRSGGVFRVYNYRLWCWWDPKAAVDPNAIPRNFLINCQNLEIGKRVRWHRVRFPPGLTLVKPEHPWDFCAVLKQSRE